jgi:hypothetical protein
MDFAPWIEKEKSLQHGPKRRAKDDKNGDKFSSTGGKVSLLLLLRERSAGCIRVP